jgi:hypothetical protein
MNLCNVAYTILTDNKYLDKYPVRKKNVTNIMNILDKKINYIEPEMFFIKNLDDYKNIKKNKMQLRKVNINGKFRLGAIGLMFTTYIMYLKLLETNYNNFLIIEDDAEIKKNFLDIFINYIKEVPKDFDIVSLYENKAYYHKYNIDSDIGLDNICLSYNDRSTLAYLISKSGIKKYLNFMENTINMPLDLFLFDNNKNTKKYAIKPKSTQIFFNDYFLINGDPNYKNSLINKTMEITIKGK